MQAVEEVGMKIQLKKCNFGKRCCKWLGHSITGEGIFPDADRVKILLEWPDPQIQKQVYSLHGLMSAVCFDFFRKDIKIFHFQKTKINY